MPHSLAPAILAALLALFPHGRGMAGMRASEMRIAAQLADASDAYDVPPAVVLVVGFHESHCGVDRGAGGGWGSPIDRRHRHTAGTARSIARDLATSFRVCGTWLAAMRRYRSGLCNREPDRGYTAAMALRLVERLSARAGVPLPERLR